MNGGEEGLEPAASAVTGWFRVLSKTAEVLRFRNSGLSIQMVAGFVDVAERKENFSCGGLQPSELFGAAF
jgi:hypothetical protein